MQSSNIQYLPRLDHLRGLAAMIVFTYHLYHHFYHNWQPNPDAWYLGLMVEGHTGVGLFFVLSGFIFMLISLKNGEIRYGDFMRNRFLRIFPLFLFVFFVAISIGRNNFGAADVLYLFFSNLGQAPTSGSFITGAAWTISVEFTFYAIFPFLAMAVADKGATYLPRLVLILLLFKLGAYFINEAPKHMLYSTLLGRLDQFLIGMMAAMIYLRAQEKGWLQQWYWLPLSLLAVWAGVGVMAHFFSYQAQEQHEPWWVLWPTFEALLWAGVCLAYLCTSLQLPRFLNAVLELMGQVSYSWYLLHALILWLWSQLIGPISVGSFGIDLLLNWLVIGSLSLAFAKLSYHTLEEPFLGMRRRYTS
ncbi:acyltransferase family protein [Marinobacterium stanieri]|uniref:acyltransferase family protein n=1 Tax=Marinobacterium stanieri TaxID=49186 RepID=UPI000255A105|nr:acyltransferase [Marinobacterium stanieri]